MSTGATIVIYFHEPEPMGYPFSDPDYYESYRNFTHFCAERDLRVVIARGNSYLGNMRFARGWQFSGSELSEITEPISADLIYHKGKFGSLQTGPDDLVINLPEFDALARNKWTSYQLLREFCPLTFQITPENWRETAASIPTSKIVLKPTLGYGGSGIHVVEKATFDFPSLGINEPYIAQEFIDSSAGIPGIVAGYHDLRVLIFNGEPKLAFVRTPKTGSLLSNVAQGGTAATLEIERVPPQMLEMARRIDEKFARFVPRFYTTDFFMQGDRPFLIETNTQPGFPQNNAEGPAFASRYYTYLYELLRDAIQASRTR